MADAHRNSEVLSAKAAGPHKVPDGLVQRLLPFPRPARKPDPCAGLPIGVYPKIDLVQYKNAALLPGTPHGSFSFVPQLRAVVRNSSSFVGQAARLPIRFAARRRAGIHDLQHQIRLSQLELSPANAFLFNAVFGRTFTGSVN